MMFQTWELEADPARNQRLAAAALAALAVLAGLFTLAVLLPPGTGERLVEPAVVVAFRPPPEVVKKPEPVVVPPPPPKIVKRAPPVVAVVAPVALPAPAPAAAPMEAPKVVPRERPPETTADQAVAERVVAVGGTGDGSGTAVGGEEAESPAPVVASAGVSGPVNLPEDAEPAEPSDDNAMPEYPESARTTGQESVVILKVVIESDGKIGKIQVMKGDEPFLTAALNAVKSWTYEPAKLEGQAISIFKIIKLPFRLRND